MSTDAKMIKLSGRTNAAVMLFNFSGQRCETHRQATSEFATGMLLGVRDWIVAQDGEARAYAIFQALADGLEVPLIAAAAPLALSPPGPAAPTPKPRSRRWPSLLVLFTTFLTRPGQVA